MMIYVASPYVHKEEKVMEYRYRAVRRFVVDQMNKDGNFYYSPIVYFHPLAQLFHLPRDSLFYKNINRDAILAAFKIIVLKLPGWQMSYGINELELPLARKYNKKVEYVEPEAHIRELAVGV